MGRLIDADKLKIYLKEYLHYEHAIPWVDAQPTAYDVEKVVTKVKDYHDLVQGCYLKEIVEIVRKGGVE